MIYKYLVLVALVGLLLLPGGVHAALSQTELTTSGNVSAGPFTTASISPTANNLVLAFIEMHTGAPLSATVTLSGNGLTWVQIATSSAFDSVGLSSSTKIYVFRAMGASPTTGAVTITPTGSVTGASWSIVQWSGVTTSGSNGSGAVVQVVTNTGRPALGGTTTMAAFASPSNGVSSMWVERAGLEDVDVINPNNGHIGNTLYMVDVPAEENIGTRSQYATTSDRFPSASFVVQAFGWGSAAVEVTAISSPTINTSKLRIVGGKFRWLGGLLRIR